MREYTADELLEAREKRAGIIDQLLKQYNIPLLCMRVNYPGLRKTNDVTLNISQDMSALLCSFLGNRVRFKSLRVGAEGPIFLAAVEEDVLVLKKAVIEVEEGHVLGRCLDLDVYDRSGRSIGRQELGYPRRKCYLCEDFAQHCVRSRRHSEQEVIDYIEDRFREYRVSDVKEVWAI
jgi:holo-ACP synthase CitX